MLLCAAVVDWVSCRCEVELIFGAPISFKRAIGEQRKVHSHRAVAAAQSHNSNSVGAVVRSVFSSVLRATSSRLQPTRRSHSLSAMVQIKDAQLAACGLERPVWSFRAADVKQQLAQQTSATLRPKILLLGSQSVGKSALLRRHLSQQITMRAPTHTHASLAPLQQQYKFSSASAAEATVAIDVMTLPQQCDCMESINSNSSSTPSTASQRRIQPTWLDCSGDMTYSGVRSEFMHDWHCVVLCFDICSPKSFEQLELLWCAELQQATTGPNNAAASPLDLAGRCVVCATKCDTKSQRTLSDREIKKWLSKRSITEYHETSAKSGLNISTAMDAAKRLAIKQLQRAAQQQTESATPPQSQQKASAATASNAARQSTPNKQQQQQQSASRPISASSVPIGTASLDTMSLSELKSELQSYRMSSADCLEKSELVERVRTTRLSMTASRAATQLSHDLESITTEVLQWTLHKDIRAMLNDIHALAPTDATYLHPAASLQPVQLAYRRALLKIHPDKLADQSDERSRHRATELFKHVNSAFEAFRTKNEKRSANNSQEGKRS